MPSRLCVQTWREGTGSPVWSLLVHGWGCWGGSECLKRLHFFNPEIFWPNSDLLSLWNEECFIRHLHLSILWEFRYLQNSSKRLFCDPVRGNLDLPPRPHHCFLTAPPLSLHPLPSLDSQLFEPVFGTQDFPVAQTVKHLPTVRDTWARSLGWEDPLERAMATHSSTLA